MVKETSADHLPIAGPRSSGANEALSNASEAGTIKAAEIPCKARKKIRAEAELDKAQPREVRANRPMPQ